MEPTIYMKPGVYRHYKGGLYTVLFSAWDSTNGNTREELVIYVSHEKGTVNARKLSEFSEFVATEDAGGHSVRVPRFSFIR